MVSVPLTFTLPLAAQQPGFTRADTLRGSNGPARAWWDAAFYDLHVAINPADSSIMGWNGITYRVLEPAAEMQIDLQEPLVMDSVVQTGRRLEFRRDGNAFFVTLAEPQRAGELRIVTAYYHGKPVAAVRPPWDGGFIWRRDSWGTDWVATANEGLGASVWWPNKDFGADEPDSQRVAITVPSGMTNVSNGRLRGVTPHSDGTTTFEWFVANPINNYNISVNAGAYAYWTEEFEGEDGALTVEFWALAEDVEWA
jgi:aminopeptidase N